MTGVWRRGWPQQQFRCGELHTKNRLGSLNSGKKSSVCECWVLVGDQAGRCGCNSKAPFTMSAQGKPTVKAVAGWASESSRRSSLSA